MAYVIAEPCIGTKDTACVDACPVDCIHPKKDSDKYATEEMLYIEISQTGSNPIPAGTTLSFLLQEGDVADTFNVFTPEQNHCDSAFRSRAAFLRPATGGFAGRGRNGLSEATRRATERLALSPCLI